MKIEIKSKISYFLYRDDKEFSLNAIKEFEKWKFEGKKRVCPTFYTKLD